MAAPGLDVDTGVEQPEPDGWYSGEGSIGWKLDNIITLPEPVKCKGSQGVWTLPPDVLAQVRAQLELMRQQAVGGS